MTRNRNNGSYIYIYIYIYIGIVKMAAFFATALQHIISTIIVCCSAAAKFCCNIAFNRRQPMNPMQVTIINAIKQDATTTKQLRPSGGWSTSGPQGSVLSTPQILDPSMKDWYQYWPWNLTHRVPLGKSMHMTYHTTALLPYSCGTIADGPFRDPKGRSYPHPKYWTHRWRIDINISHEI